MYYGEKCGLDVERKHLQQEKYKMIHKGKKIHREKKDWVGYLRLNQNEKL